MHATAPVAFSWIVGILRELDVPFQISGGLAAKAYGSDRPLNDIDIDVPDERLDEIATVVRKYITFGPAHLQDGDWDLMLLTLDYNGQMIDLGGCRAVKVFDKATKRWVDISGGTEDAMEREVLGMTVPVIHPQALIDYKRILSRTIDGKNIDLEDVEAIALFRS